MRGSTNRNRNLQLVLKMMKLVVPEIIHDCPYVGRLVLHLKGNKAISLMYPPSLHRLLIHGIDDDSKATFNIYLEYEIL